MNGSRAKVVSLDEHFRSAPASKTAMAELTQDAFLGDRLTVLQPKSGYRAGTDAVLLAASVGATRSPELRVLDVGAGVGVVGLCVAARIEASRVVLVEKNSDLATLARKNVLQNGFTDRVDVVDADVLGRANELELEAESFDHVLSNPPFYDAGAARASSNNLKAAAHVMPSGGLDNWLRFMARMTRPGGQATMIHVAERLGDVIGAFERRFGGLLLQPLHPRAGVPANRIIVQGTKGSRRPMQLLAGIVLHNEGHGFQPEIDQILRAPNPLHLGSSGTGALSVD